MLGFFYIINIKLEIITKMKEHTDTKQEGAESRGNRYGGGFKKKKGFKKTTTIPT